MVAPHADISAAPSTVSPLSPADDRLFHAWFLAKGDLALLSERIGIPIPNLVAWSRTPAIAAMIADLEALQAISDRFHRSATHRDAIDKLVHVLNTSTNLVEIRRAATTILRGPTQPRARSQRPEPILPAPGEVVPPRPEGAPSLPPLPTLREPQPSPSAAAQQPSTPRPKGGDLPGSPQRFKPLSALDFPPQGHKSRSNLLALVGTNQPAHLTSSLDHIITSSSHPP
jgi:hypothetical protein